MDHQFRTEKITKAHSVENFHCEEEQLNEFLKKYALENEKSGRSSTYVVVEQGKNVVIGYYAISATKIAKAEATDRVGAGQPEGIPGILLGQLARDKAWKGTELGSALVKDAFIKVVNIAQMLGARILLVDALNDKAKDIWTGYGFSSSPTNDKQLMLLLKDLRKSMGLEY